MEGNKFDIGKTEWSLLPWEEVEQAVKAMMYGAKKYNERPENPNWIKVDDGYNRYFNALMRHITAQRRGEYLDQESGLPHMSHAIFNILALSHFARKREEEKHKCPSQDNRTNSSGVQYQTYTGNGR